MNAVYDGGLDDIYIKRKKKRTSNAILKVPMSLTGKTKKKGEKDSEPHINKYL